MLRSPIKKVVENKAKRLVKCCSAVNSEVRAKKFDLKLIETEPQTKQLFLSRRNFFQQINNFKGKFQHTLKYELLLISITSLE
jgi:hypothetical protein